MLKNFKKKKIVSPQLTGGDGFQFENKVVAYFLSCLLSGVPPLASKLGNLKKVDFQTAADGWGIDDILLSFEKQERRCALSIKSNQQFSRNGLAPQEFVRQAWEQYLHKNSIVFNAENDFLGLITAPLNAETLQSVFDVLKYADKQTSKDLSQRIVTPAYSKIIKGIFFSFRCPPDLATEFKINDESIGDLLKRLTFDAFDFGNPSSDREKLGIKNCQDSLANNTYEEAQNLWSRLIEIAGEYRPKSGCLDLPILVSLLMDRFRLKVHPQYGADWEKLLSQTKNNLSTIQDMIGNAVFIERDKDLVGLQATIQETKICFLIGSSGCGKTVLAKTVAGNNINGNGVLWLNARQLEFNTFSLLEQSFNLSYPIEKVLFSLPYSSNYLILDGLDRVYSSSVFQNLAILLQKLRTTPWKVIIPCQSEELDRVKNQLASTQGLGSSTDWKKFEVPDLEMKDLAKVWETFPQLKRLTVNPKLRPILLKPKILDLLGTKIISGVDVDTSKWVGESDLIAWFWETIICRTPGGSVRERFLLQLAEKQGDHLKAGISISEFAAGDLTAYDELEREQILRKVDGKIFFSHDLYGDWSRQRCIIAQETTLQAYLEPRVASSLWQRAIRLYGLHLLERRKDIALWRSAVEKFAIQGKISLAQELLVESAVFAVDALPILESIWDDLKAQKGFLLRCLLNRFLYVATLPNPTVAILVKQLSLNLETQAETINRIPYWPYWLPMLEFLFSHKDEVVILAPKVISEIADIWLRLSDKNWKCRSEAAELALQIAEQVYEFKNGKGIRIVNDDLDKVSYRAALAAVYETPERVKQFSLHACARHPATPVIKKIVSRSQFLESTYEDELPDPWLDGPKAKVDSAFREVCMQSDALLPIIDANPLLASEIVLSLLIDPPKPKPRFYEGHHSFFDELELNQDQEWYPPFYTKGPFLLFLRSKPDAALGVILKVVNFATERWRERVEAKGAKAPSLKIAFLNQETNYIGNQGVYFWYRDQGHCPDVVATILMVLEKWLYEQIDAGVDVTNRIESILKNTNSLAFVGLFAAIGYKNTRLFETVLRPLLAVAVVHLWELHFQTIAHNTSVVMMPWTMQGKEMIQLAKEWNELPHRKNGVHNLAGYFLLNYPEMEDFFKEARANWQVQEKTMKDIDFKEFLQKLIIQFNPKNYRTDKHPQYGNVWVFNPPQDYQKRVEKKLKENSDQMTLISFPLKCRQLLDSNKPLNQQDLDSFCASVSMLRKNSFKAQEGVVQIDDALCGGAAVLIKFHRDWLKNNHEWEAWATRQILRTIDRPPKQDNFEHEDSKCNWRWDSFCAEVIPILLSEDIKSKSIRKAVALLAITQRYETIQILFSSAAKVRHVLREDFRQLENLALTYSKIRWQVRREHLRNKKVNTTMAKMIQKRIEKFVKGIKADEEFFSTVTVEKIPEDKYIPSDKKFRRHVEVDISMVLSVFNWLPPLKDAVNPQERSEWIATWKGLLKLFLLTFDKTAPDDEYEGTPYEEDYQVLRTLAWVMLQLESPDEARTFWEPIVNLGTAAHYWVDDFLSHFIYYGLQIESSQAKFVEQWKSVLNDAFTSEGWDFAKTKNRFHLDDLWNAIMGLDSITIGLWGEKQRPIVKEMFSNYKRWANICLQQQVCMYHFIIFLKKPAAENLLPEALTWIWSALDGVNDYYWRHYDIEGGLASLLDICWHKYNDRLRANGACFDAFKQILTILVERHNTLAMALQEKLA